MLSVGNLIAFHTVVFDFDGVFTDNKVLIDNDGKESVCCNRADGLAFDFVRAYQKSNKLNLDFFILSKESNPVVLVRSKKMQLKCHHGVKNKLLFLQAYFIDKGYEQQQGFDGLIYVGNDLNDFSVMSQAGFSVAPKDSHSRILEIADLVLQRNGGDGCVREFIEYLLDINCLSKEELHELISNC